MLRGVRNRLAEQNETRLSFSVSPLLAFNRGEMGKESLTVVLADLYVISLRQLMFSSFL